ncbi:hypothetical protein GCM10023310_69780 [Paenibacillus vulneris]|uniref:Uncharacterized protein n=1 Tax=Paenibacillus vulneris TaxID=1133364 RepID=A0ABW3UGP4_9BACL
MFTDKKIRDRFTDEELAEVFKLIRSPDNKLLGRFIDALVDDRREVIREYLYLSEQPKRKKI